MRVLIFGINYSPELTGIGKYTGEMGAWLAGRGHQVSVVTAHPYYPEWAVHPDYKGKGWFKEHMDGVTVYRVPLYVPRAVTAGKRVLHEFSFLGAVVPPWFRLLLKKRYDVVININPPFHLGFLPLFYARMKGARLITHIQDLQVDAARDLGMIRNKWLLRMMFKAERYILAKSDAVSSISLGMRRKILEKGVAENKFILFPNWVDEGYIRPLPRERSLRAAWGLSQTDKVVLYSGNLGEKQGLEIIVEAAAHFRNKQDIRFVIVGSGGAKDRLREQVKVNGLKNVKFYPLQPYEQLSALLATADVHLVLQKKTASDLVMPSKLSGILAAGGCSIVTALPGSSLYEIVASGDTGILIEPESAPALIAGLEKAFSSNLCRFRENARAYAERALSKDRILREFEQEITLNRIT